MAQRVLSWTSFVALLTVIGCSSPKMSSTDPLGGVPDDFSVDVTLLSDAPGHRAHQTSARLVLLADGALHYEEATGRGPNTMPLWVRHLDREDMARLWDSAVRLGLTDAQRADATADFRRAQPPTDGSTTWLVALTGEGERWNFLRHWSQDEQPDAALQDFVRDALALAWAEDAHRPRARVEPTRWAYGEDPWKVWNDRVNAAKAEPVEAVQDEGAGGDEAPSVDVEAAPPNAHTQDAVSVEGPLPLEARDEAC